MTIIDDRSILSHGILKIIFDSFPNPAYVWQKIEDDFILIDYNAAAEKEQNIDIKNLLNTPASEFFKETPLILQKMNECMLQKQGEIKEIKYAPQANDKLNYLSINFFLVPDDLIIIYINDISKQKLIELDLKQSEEKYKHLFEQAPFPIVLLDQNGSIIDCNQATVKIFGYSKEDLIHKNYLKLSAYPLKYLPLLKERLQNTWNGIIVKPTEFKIYKKDGSIIWITSLLSIVKLRDVKILQAILLDLSEIKQANQLIEHKLEIEKLISSVSSRFISNIDIDDAIDYSLIEMGKLIGASNAYLLLNNEDKTVEFYSQVSCSETTKHNKINLVNSNVDDFPWIQKEYEKKGYVYIKNVSDLPEKEIHTKAELQKLNIESLVLFPIKINEKLLGFIGFDDLEGSTRWRRDDFTLLKTSSEIIGNALQRKWSEETLKNTNQLLTAILCSLTESIILIDKEFNIIWVNNETQNLFNSQFEDKKCYEFLLNSNKPCKHCIAKKCFTDGKIHEYEYIFQGKKDLKIKCWCTTNIASKNKNGEIELVLIILREIANINKITQS